MSEENITQAITDGTSEVNDSLTNLNDSSKNDMQSNQNLQNETIEFDWQFYLELYPDLAVLSNEEKAYEHWVNLGQQEGRVGNKYQFAEIYLKNLPADFDWQEYLALNPDLQFLIQNDSQAIAHFVMIGKNEGRNYIKDNLEFDAEFYLEMYSDLKKVWTLENVYEHWKNLGKKEGRVSSWQQFNEKYNVLKKLPKDFDWQEYLHLNYDIQQTSKTELETIIHFLTLGISEKRIYSYKQLSKDIAIEYLQKLLKNNCSNYETYEKLAIYLEEENETTYAKIAYQTSIQLNCDTWMSYYRLGNLFLTDGLFSEAKDNYNKAIKIEPNEYLTYIKLADTLVKLEKWELALTNCEKAISLLKNKFKDKSLFCTDKQNIYSNLSYSYFLLAQIAEYDQDWLLGSKYYSMSLFLEPQELLSRKSLKLLRNINFKDFFSNYQYYFDNLELPEYWIFIEVFGNRVEGWVINRKEVSKQLELKIFIDKQFVIELIANKNVVTLQNLGLNNQYGFDFVIPDKYLDSQEHEIILKTIDQEKVIVTKRFKIEINGYLDMFNLDVICGWLVDKNSPEKSLAIDIYLDRNLFKSLLANKNRPDLLEKLGHSEFGFEEKNSLNFDQIRGTELIVTLKDSLIPILETPLVFLPQSGQINSLNLLQHSIEKLSCFSVSEKQFLMKNLLPQVRKLIREKRENILFKVSSMTVASKQKSEVTNIVDIIVPVYKNLEVTQECLNRLLNSLSDYLYNVIVINDCSPEIEIWEYLNNLSETGKINLITHRQNQGFVKSVNEGMKFNINHDVVLLNSDAYVSDYWLDNLHKAVYQSANIATGTPLSNSATIFTYPIMCEDEEKLPSDLNLEELSEICRRVNSDNIIDVPVGHGFCLYIKREALKEIGYFDEEKWKKGYGEETDWCQKAKDLGWKHIAVPSVFVQHIGSQSFSSSQAKLIKISSNKLISELYPEYNAMIQNFIKSDPLASARRRIDVERLKIYGQQKSKFLLMISHSSGGGTQRHLEDMVDLLEKEDVLSLVLQPDLQFLGWVNLTFNSLELKARYNINEDNDVEELVKDLHSLGIFHIHVHHTLGFVYEFIPDFLSRLKLSYDVTIHDYLLICPRINLVGGDNKYCQEPPAEICDICVKKNGITPSYLADDFKKIGSTKDWRSLSGEFLTKARKIFVPSNDVADRMSKYFSELQFTVRPHHNEEKVLTLVSNNSGEIVRVGIIGAIQDIKGMNVIYDCASYAYQIGQQIEFTIIGYTANDNLFADLPNVIITGPYKQKELSLIIQQSSLDFVAFFNIWPETYSYTLTETLENGLYPFAFDIGAIAERVAKLEIENNLIDRDINIVDLVKRLYNFGIQCRKQNHTINVGIDYHKKLLNNYYEIMI